MDGDPRAARREVDVAALVASARDGSARALGRLVTLVENGSTYEGRLAAELGGIGDDVHVVGLTGSPGVGKSTTTSALVSCLRARGRRVAVLAVDPSSPFTGGALLGDRIRMGEHALDPDVFVRSMASRGHLGGLAATTPQAIRVLAGCGFDTVLVETVGVGQSEVEILGAADTTVVLLAPGMGDGIQAAKAGILEIADLFAVNKADRDGAAATVRDLRAMLSLAAPRAPHQWRPPVLSLVAARGEGIAELADALAEHHRWLCESGTLAQRRRDRARAEIETLVVARLRAALTADRTGEAGGPSLQSLAAQVVSGEMTAPDAAERVWQQVRQ